MKIFRNILLFTLLAAFIVACEREGFIDPISKVEPGPDNSAPFVEINYPTQGTAIRVREDTTAITIDFEVRDDIELQSILIELDGSQITKYTDFKDYRRVLEEFVYENVTNGEHTLTLTATDMQDKSTSQSVDFEKIAPYETQYDGEIFYMPFDGNAMELITISSAEEVGNPGYSSGLVSQAYQGAAESYLTFPVDTLVNESISAAFWYHVDPAATATRAGMLTVGPPSDNDGDRTQGFRLFRVGNETRQTIRLNVGKGDGDSWYTAGGDYRITLAEADWMHVAFTISSDSVAIFLDGELAAAGAFEGPIGWADCEILSIGSGAPNFAVWNHLSDINSLYDELRFFNRFLTQAEIQAIMEEQQK